jgi:hypothetical protein
MNIISGATNLEAIYSQSEVAIKKLQNEWHRAFISINETLGGLEDKKARAEAGERVFIGSGQPEVKSGGMSKGTKTFLIIVVIAAIVAVVLLTPNPISDLYKDAWQQMFG